MDLFDYAVDQHGHAKPLADVVRPRTLDEFFGQSDVSGPGSVLRRMIESDRVTSVLFWGPPGVGKTTLAGIIAEQTKRRFESISAVLDGVKEIRKHVERAHEERRYSGRQTILFIDEIHRFNKAQQDALLPHIETGTFILIGATTENPSFYVNSAVLSRCRVVPLGRHDLDSIVAILHRALHHSECVKRWPGLNLDEDVIKLIAQRSEGDARRALNVLEIALNDGRAMDSALLSEVIGKPVFDHDRDGDSHYDVISALIKSMRASEPDAAAYWAQRLVMSGEDPLFLFRRLIIFASEDIGHADSNALQVATAALDAFRFVGMPEGNYALMQAVTYLATAPKSDTIKKTLLASREAVKDAGSAPVPSWLRQSTQRPQTDRLDEQADTRDALPKQLEGRHLFQPSGVGQEQQFIERLKALNPSGRSPSSD
ncbi:MAG: replication-associated recombination protein A [Myxococcota bacterium]|nr:replication-associated recombination protein A [Myxococcota bacterium]